MRYFYFEWYFFCLRNLGFGRFEKLKQDKIIVKQSKETFLYPNFTSVYLAKSMVPLFFLITVPTFELWEFVSVWKKQEDIIKTLMFTGVHIVMMVKFLMYFWKSHNMKLIAYLIEVEAKKYSQDYHLINKTKRLTNMILVACYVNVALTVILACASAKMPNISLAHEESANITEVNSALPFKIKIPFTVDTKGKYLLAYVLQVTGITFYGIKQAEEMYKNRSESCFGELGITMEMIQIEVESELKHLIEHHQLIIRCASLIEETYTFGFFAHLFSGLLSLALGMGALVAEGATLQEKAMVVYYLFTMLIEQGLLCWAGNELTYQSIEVATALTSSRWYLFDINWKRNALVISVQAQRPLVLTSGKFVDLSYASFVNTLKAAYSYYTVLTRT